MSTSIELARAGRASAAAEKAAEVEGWPVERVLRGLADGTMVVPANASRKRPVVIGGGSRVKINANIGSSADSESLEDELQKLKVAVAHGSDTVMDLSTGPRWREILSTILERSPVPVGTVPLYQVFGKVMSEGGEAGDVTEGMIFDAVDQHCRAGVDYLTLHCGVTRRAVGLVRGQGRRLGIVSRGGSLMAEWMKSHGRENPLYEHFDRLIEILGDRDVTFSLGDGMRPGCIADASDRAQIEELVTLGELQKRSLDAGVQVMVEGP